MTLWLIWHICTHKIATPKQIEVCRTVLEPRRQLKWSRSWSESAEGSIGRGAMGSMKSFSDSPSWTWSQICWIYIYIYIYIYEPGPRTPTPPPPPQWYPPPPLLTPPTPPKPSICMLFAHIHTHIHIYTPLSTPPTSHLYVICSTWEPRPRQRTLSTCIFLS